MKILVFAPHADDEVLGCGGVIAKSSEMGAEVHVCIVTNAFPPVGDDSEAVKNGWPINLYSEAMAAKRVLGIKDYHFLLFPAVLLETVPRNELNGKIQKLVDDIKPDIVYIPHLGDMQKDHVLTAEAVMVAMRPKGRHIVRKVYSYETLSETEWNIPHSRNAFIPNTYVDISGQINKKFDALACYQSQIGVFPNPRSIEAVRALAMYRGSTCGGEAAEAFMLIRDYQK